jgi:hypothetical protein
VAPAGIPENIKKLIAPVGVYTRAETRSHAKELNGSGSRALGPLRVQLGFAGIPRFLILIEAFVGRFKKLGSGKAVHRIDGKANANGERRRVALQAKTTGDAFSDVLRAGGVGIQEENCELISAVTRGNPCRGTVPSLREPGDSGRGFRLDGRSGR